ncbi:MAG: C4-dicarboxylate ABC transporter permease, partial [Actinomycetota bacterium]|nr:C4-dicarboxylate ABC transporter permease [Actinomycetota bacterium]
MSNGPGSTGTTAAVDVGRSDDKPVIAQDAERPARRLTGLAATGITAASALIAVFVLYQVFWPLAQGNQFALILFLAATLPLVFLCYRSGIPLGRRGNQGRDNPTAADYALAALAVAVCLYPVVPVPLGTGGGGFDAFLDRQGILAAPDVVAGAVLLALVLEACRRTTGWVLPAVCLLFVAYSYYGGLVPQ